MVAISLYRGNLHQVPDVPRRWPAPTPKLSLKEFRVLLNRRSRARSLLFPSAPSIAATSNPNSLSSANPDDKPSSNRLGEAKIKEDQENGTNNDDELEKQKDDGTKSVGEIDNDLRGSTCDDCLVKQGEQSQGKSSIPVDASGVSLDQKAEVTVNPTLETLKDVELNDKEKRKKDIEEKLQVLNARKHNLVQLLKQILNAEEELGRRMAVHPPVPLQVDVTNDSGSMSRHVTPRPVSGVNSIGDLEGADTDDVSNPNTHSRAFLQTSSISPSSDSSHKRPFSMVPHPLRATSGVVSSPSRFAPTGQLGNPGSHPTVSVSGTNYIASSPSPAGSGGTSVFRETRHPSPWNY